MKKLVVLSGAGISAESGLATFRDSGGLWEGYDITEVATPEGWSKNPELVLEFYNMRRKQALEALPNEGHLALARLQEMYDVTIITQNVDNLHEKAGSKKVLHLHGELFKCRSTVDEKLIYHIEGWELNLGDNCEKGSQLRPHIVWFGEMVPMMDDAIAEARNADIFVIVGTSLQVYPAAGLLHYVKAQIPTYIIDPKIPAVEKKPEYIFLEESGSTGLQKLEQILRY